MTEGSIRLGNRRPSSDQKPELGEVIVCIDRGTPLGNPYRITDKRSRAEAIRLFKIDFECDLRQRQGPRYAAVCRIIELLYAGEDVILMCWCAPFNCHGSVIIDAIKKLMTPSKGVI